MKIAVIFCTWKRIHLLQKLLNNLQAQINVEIDIFIWNNNKEIKEKVNHIISGYDNIKVKHSDVNIGGIGRFYYAKEISDLYPSIVFIDDDQELQPDVICKMIKHHKKHSILSWYGWKVNKEYFDRIRVLDFTNVDYCGTGGMIVDSELFKELKLEKIDKNYSFIEDLWLSFIAKYEYGYELLGGDFNIIINKDGLDQFEHLRSKKEVYYKILYNKYRN